MIMNDNDDWLIAIAKLMVPALCLIMIIIFIRYKREKLASLNDNPLPVSCCEESYRGKR